MPKIPNDPRFNPSYEISQQLENLIKTQGIDLSTATDLSDDDIDFLLNNIRIESKKKETLMSIVKYHNITDPTELKNLKIKVLLDNLAKKMCRCVRNVQERGLKTRCINVEDTKCIESSANAICRPPIFHNRNIDFYTYSCDKDGPILYPKVDTKQILHKK